MVSPFKRAKAVDRGGYAKSVSEIRFATISLLLVSTLMMAPAAHAQIVPDNDNYEARAMHAFLLYCLPALGSGDTVEHIATLKRLPELIPAAENAFLNGKPGKVYALPEVGGGIVLTAPQQPLCSIIIQKLDAKEFLTQANYWFDPEHTPFKIKDSRTLPNGELHREYVGNMSGANLLLVLSLRSEPVEGGIQAMLTGGRTQ